MIVNRIYEIAFSLGERRIKLEIIPIASFLNEAKASPIIIVNQQYGGVK
jgi:hypothetical protein